MPIPELLLNPHLRLILFGGKGGVGKTTCAASSAIQIAKTYPSRSLLLVSTDPAHSLEDSFSGGTYPSNLEVLEFNMREHLDRFREMHGGKLKDIARRGTFLDEQDIERFLNLSLPGMDEVLAFLEISRMLEGGRRYDCIVVDTAPTGHTLNLLAMPEFIHDWVAALDVLLAKHRYMKEVFSGGYEADEIDEFLEGLAHSVERTEALLKNPDRCVFLVVMLAEQLSIKETEDLLSKLREIKIRIGAVLVNRVYVEIACDSCNHSRMQQLNELTHLPKGISKYPLWTIPLYPFEVRGTDKLEMFWERSRQFTIAEARKRYRLASRTPCKPQVKLLVQNPANLPAPGMELLIFAGKGGVGKTTLACATAIRLATEDRERRILLFSTDPAHSLSDCLDTKIGNVATGIIHGLVAMEMDTHKDFDVLKREYQDEITHFLGSISQNIDLMFDRQAMEKMMDLAPPGLDEIMAVTQVMDYLASKSFDFFILDSAPTGHLIRLLELPEILDQWLKGFFELFLKYKQLFGLPGISERLVKMSKDLKLLRNTLKNPEKAAVYAVSIPTQMTLNETQDLVDACEQMEISVPTLFLNMVTPENECQLCRALREREAQVLYDFRSQFPEKYQTVVYRKAEPRGLAALQELGEHLYRS